MKTWIIPVEWKMCANIEVEANTLAEAMEVARDDEGVIPIPSHTESDYIDGSWSLSYEEDEASMDEVRDLFNNGQEDE